MKLVLLLLVAVTLVAQTPRIAVGGIMHESNTFSADLTELADFSRWRGDEVRGEFAESSHEVGGYYEGAQEFGHGVRCDRHARTRLIVGRKLAPIFDVTIKQIGLCGERQHNCEKQN